MYLLATTSKYQNDTKYYSKSGNTYTLLVAGTDYTIGGNISSGIYELAEMDRIYIRNWGSSSAYNRFPYKASGRNTLPEFDASQNDVDLDAYTNLKGRTVRNRQRSNVKTLDFGVPLMEGSELHDLFTITKKAWLDVLFFDEESWNMISKKMYRSATVSYHKYYIDKTNANRNLYTSVKFAFIEE